MKLEIPTKHSDNHHSICDWSSTAESRISVGMPLLDLLFTSDFKAGIYSPIANNSPGIWKQNQPGFY